MFQSARDPAKSGSTRVLSLREFVLLIALVMSLGSLSIDNLLPAFGPIQANFAIADPNDLQLLITTYMVPFAILQTVYGPVSDALGRRPTLMIGLTVYLIGGVVAATAASFSMLLIGRAVQGAGLAATRVLTVAIIRDRYEGREMARVMSITLMVFIIVPMLAPASGSLLLLLGTWRMIFATVLGFAVLVAVWFYTRMPETLHPEYRRSFAFGQIASAVRTTISTRVSIGYATGIALMMGCLMAYIGSAQQIFETEAYELGVLFPLVFGCIAAFMGAASFTSARLVRRLGMRRLSHIGICGFTLVAAVQVGVAFIYDGRPPLLLYVAIFAISQFLYSLTVPNFNSIAMAPLAAIAGTASSFIGSYTTFVGALFGLVIGRSFNGTVIPLSLGYLCLGAACLLVVLWTEKGRLSLRSQPEQGAAKRALPVAAE
ncbi:multidrug effflux MFS transporter [Microvirga subterranea]|uniref:DHA1 family bicyclomycin/chloramphenicol resistance-like MFS transporter n=1 Tax=Microvirga subterranea TaxID=186651 RepID=A0A370HCJ7_9HYPH|nr:multidrug effflux MFS transporter [Microvirga subterranea]RDI52583.1 DHA1 family bicyclomycin/chloramphenicol resistance-like MFS transporter [Microvirga subterranea]